MSFDDFMEWVVEIGTWFLWGVMPVVALVEIAVHFL